MHIVIALVALYCIIVLALWAMQRSLFYYPDPNLPSSAEVEQFGFAPLGISVPDIGDGEMTSYWRPPADPTKPVVIHFHGNAGNIGSRLPVYQQLTQDGAGLLAMGYPAYGGNIGDANEQNFYADAQAHYAWLISHGIAPERIVAYGESIGTGPATWLASQQKVAGLVLEAPYAAFDELLAQKTPFVPAKLIARDRYRSIDRIANIAAPLLWIHGEEDTLIPISEGQRLFDAAKSPKRAVKLIDTGHNDIWRNDIGPLVRANIHDFGNIARD